MARAIMFSGIVYQGDTTAALRAAGAELDAAMIAAGLTRTGDTGQLDFATATNPGTTNTSLGYTTWNIMGGALKLRIEYRSGQSAGSPMKFVCTVGTGTNGTGGITGALYTGAVQGSAGTIGAGSYPSFVSNPATNDFFALVYKVGGQTATGMPSPINLCVEKIVDATGTPDGSGYAFTDLNPASNQTQGTRKGVNVGGGTYSSPQNVSCCLIPGSVTDSSVGADKQVFLHAFPTPRMKFGIGVVGVVASEYPVNTTFNACLIGDPATKTRGYVSVANGLGCPAAHAPTSTAWSNAILWEP